MVVVFAFLVLTLASARVTRLIVHDKLSAPIKRAIIMKLGSGHWFVYLIHCPYCTSFWTSLGASAFGIALTGVSWWWLLPAALAMSYLVAPILVRTFEGD